MLLKIGENRSFINYGINESQIHETHRYPDRFESLKNDFSLSLKSFQTNWKHLNHLLVGSQKKENQVIFGFAYWIPNDLINAKIDLESHLELFAHRFGYKMRVMSKESYYFNNTERLIEGKIKDNIPELFQVLAPDSTPYESHLTAEAEYLGSISKISIFYLFTINIYKYLSWIENVETIELTLKSKYHSYVRERLLDNLNPNGQTKIKIKRQKSNIHLEEDDDDKFRDLEVPELYHKPLKYIFDSLNSLKKDELLFFEMSFESPRCLFCNSEDLSKEHIFSKWLRIAFKDDELSGEVIHRNPGESLKKVFDRSINNTELNTLYGTTISRVCKNCNNGWMSRLEKNVKAILIKDNKLKTDVRTLSIRDKKELGLWILVKVILLWYKTNPTDSILDSQVMTKIFNGEIDESIVIEVTTIEEYSFANSYSASIPYFELVKLEKITEHNAKRMLSDFFVGCLHLGNLLFRVSYLPIILPFKRVSTLKKTDCLYPPLHILEHEYKKTDDELWKKLITSNEYLYLFPICLIPYEKIE